MGHLFKVKEGDMIVSITFAWEGAIALVGEDGDGALVSHRFPTYKFNEKKVIPMFFNYLMTTNRFFHELGLISPGGAGRNRVLNKQNFLKIKVKIPSIDEQRKIAGLLRNIDEQLENLSKEIEYSKIQKLGFIQRLLTDDVVIGS